MADKKDIRNNETKDEDFSDLKVFDKSDAEGNEILDQSLAQRAFTLMYPKNVAGNDGFQHNNLRGAINTQKPNVVMPGQAPAAEHHKGDVTDPKHDHRLSENKDKEREDEKQRQQNEEQQEEMQERLYPEERNKKDDDPNADPQAQDTEEHRFIAPTDPRKRVDHRASLYKQALASSHQNSGEQMTGPAVVPKSKLDYHWGPAQTAAIAPAPAAVPAAAPAATSTPHPDPRVAQIMAHPYAKQLLPTTGEITPEMVDVAHARMLQYNSLNPMQQRPTAQTAMQNNSDPLIRELSRKHLPVDRKASKDELTAFHKLVKDSLKVAKDSREKNSFQKIASTVASLILS